MDAPHIVIRPHGLIAASPDLPKLETLRRKLAGRQYKIEIEPPDPALSPADQLLLTSIGIFINEDVSAVVIEEFVKKADKTLRRWLRRHLRTNPNNGFISATIWRFDARQLLSLHASAGGKLIENRTNQYVRRPTGAAVKPVGLWDTFGDFSVGTRVVLCASFLLGLVMLVGYWMTDAGVNLTFGDFDPKPDWMARYDDVWLHSHAYIPNILAGLTSFLVGAPFALIVLATFTVQREERAALERVNKLSSLAWHKFSAAVLDLCSDERAYTGVRHGARRVMQIHDELYTEYQRRFAIAQTRNEKGNFRGVTDSELADFRALLREKVERADVEFARLSPIIGYQFELQNKWSLIRTSWNTLSQYVRLQRLERSLPWFSDDYDAQLTDQLSEGAHPLTKFKRLHDEDQSTSTSSMTAAIAIARRDADERTDSELREKFMAGYTSGGSGMVGWVYKSEFGWEAVDGYDAAAQQAHESIWGLKRIIDDINKEGWPALFSRPEEPV
ncbi:hypothetical protein [Mycolicibacterium sp. YH-1]|uniref:hypothetical protein n=1 Tax=Mycolicibacterium sp. YH-1 TaxID=2908837 RepID=UPI001F4BCE87|nr:hypothetical protein [Mycolicibacterium sp. YH-1]UNB54032.1 hypothetical protein L0M16_06760 [Mycolicibacterium sp. YH-1]